MVSYTGVWSTCMKEALNSSNLYCWIHHIPQMVSLYITYNTAEPKHKRASTPIKYVYVAYVSTIEIKETDMESMTKYLWCRSRCKNRDLRMSKSKTKKFSPPLISCFSLTMDGLDKNKTSKQGGYVRADDSFSRKRNISILAINFFICKHSNHVISNL